MADGGLVCAEEGRIRLPCLPGARRGLGLRWLSRLPSRIFPSSGNRPRGSQRLVGTPAAVSDASSFWTSASAAPRWLAAVIRDPRRLAMAVIVERTRRVSRPDIGDDPHKATYGAASFARAGRGTILPPPGAARALASGVGGGGGVVLPPEFLSGVPPEASPRPRYRAGWCWEAMCRSRCVPWLRWNGALASSSPDPSLTLSRPPRRSAWLAPPPRVPVPF